MLLESKLFRPRLRHEIVERPRLFEQLVTGLQRKLTLVLAQAGFGKTTLVAHWLASFTAEQATTNTNAAPSVNDALSGCRVAWVSLDENDNEPLRFFDYLLTALKRTDANIGQQARYLLAAPQPPTSLEPLVISLINDLTHLSNHLILILDDYHTITAQAVHQLIQTLISHAPDYFHLLIISRSEPPLPLTRWRISREVVEIRENDLRFTLDEAMTYLLDTMRCTISPADVAALEQRTEGWIVGLHLAALSLQSHPDAAAFIAEFTGSHAYLVDYLTEEVLQRQPSEIQEFLFQTPLLTRFCGPLCDAVMERTDSQQMLEYLERSHLFVVPLDNVRGWYRYHHLFAEMLRRRAQGLNLHRRADAFRRAALWHVEQDLVMEAVEYALAASSYTPTSTRDSELAAELIERCLPTLLPRGHYVTLLQWLDRLPLEVMQTRPRLCATRAQIAVRQHKLDEAEKWLELTWNALAAQSPQGRPQAAPETTQQTLEVTGHAYAIRVDLALNRGRIAETIQLANEALAKLPQELIRVRGEILFYLGIAYYWDDQYPNAVTVTKQAAHLAAEAGDILMTLNSWVNLSRFAHTQGELHEANHALDQAWAYACEHNAQQLPLMGSYHNNRAEVFYHWNRLDAAEEHFLQAIQLSEQVQNPRTLLRACSLLVPVYHATGKAREAEESVQRALRLMRQYEMPVNMLDECSRTILRKWMDEGKMAEAEEWFATRKLPLDSLDQAAVRGLEPEYALVARYLALQGKQAAAVDLLEKIAASAKTTGKMAIYIAIQAHHALLLEEMGDEAAAHTLLAQIIEIAQPQGFIRVFVDEGEAMQRLLATIQPLLNPKLQGYVRILLQAFGQPAQTAPLPAAGLEYIERLSERELEVLRLVNEGLSDSQIAARLILATGTVKRHLNNIYGKLGVHNRTHALARARTLQLI